MCNVLTVPPNWKRFDGFCVGINKALKEAIMSASIYGNIRGKRMLIRVVALPDTEKKTLDDVKSFAEDFFGAKDVTVVVNKEWGAY